MHTLRGGSAGPHIIVGLGSPACPQKLPELQSISINLSVSAVHEETVLHCFLEALAFLPEDGFMLVSCSLLLCG